MARRPHTRFRMYILIPTIGSFVISCLLFGESKYSRDFDRRYHKLFKNQGAIFSSHSKCPKSKMASEMASV